MDQKLLDKKVFQSPDKPEKLPDITASGLASQLHSLHSSVVIDHWLVSDLFLLAYNKDFSMFVFGSWVPLLSSDKTEQYSNEKERKCTNMLASFNLSKSNWKKSLINLKLFI
jgi:hypothetical protein